MVVGGVGRGGVVVRVLRVVVLRTARGVQETE